MPRQQSDGSEDEITQDLGKQPPSALFQSYLNVGSQKLEYSSHDAPEGSTPASYKNNRDAQALADSEISIK